MSAFLATFLIFLLAVLGLATGLLTGRGPIRGSCGGIARITGEPPQCGCSEPCPRRRRELERQAARHP